MAAVEYFSAFFACPLDIAANALNGLAAGKEKRYENQGSQ
jgi:hypothetical protein